MISFPILKLSDYSTAIRTKGEQSHKYLAGTEYVSPELMKPDKEGKALDCYQSEIYIIGLIILRCMMKANI